MNRRRARTVWRALARAYPDAGCALSFASPFQLLVATVLSAQCTDKAVNRATPALFRRFPDAAAFARAAPGDVAPFIRSLGLWRAKARNLVAAARVLEKDHEGEIPRTMDALVRLPGVGRKTANVVLGNAFRVAEGIAVDTHAGRVARRLGLTRHEDPAKVEKDLMALFSPPDWAMTTHLFIAHGRAVCRAPRPRCSECPVARLCPSAERSRLPR